MAFNLQNWARTSVSANEPLSIQTLNGVTIALNGCFRTYNYYGITYTGGAVTGDSQATMFAADYFDDVAYDLQINDLITCWSALDLTYQQYEVIQVTGGNGQPQVILAPLGNLTAVVVLTAAQVIAMNAAPVQIVAAPGVGTSYQVINWSVNMRPLAAGAVAYTGGTNVVLQYNNTAAGAGTQAAAPIPGTAITGGTVSRTGMGGAVTAFGGLTSLVANQPIFISNTGTAFATGNGTVVIEMTYEILQTL